MTTKTPATSSSRSILWLALPFCLLWTSAFPATKLVLADGQPLSLLGLRFVIAGGLLTGWALWRGDRLPFSPRLWLHLAVFALANPTLYLGLSWMGMVKVSSGLTTILISLNPVIVALMAALLLGERLTPAKALGLLLGMGGVVIVVQARLGGSGGEDPMGVVLVGLALLALAGSTLLWKAWPLTVPPVLGAGLQLLLSGLYFLPVAALTETPSALTLTPALLGGMLWIIGPVSIGAYLLWFRMLDRTTASAASAWHFLNPPLGLAMSALILGETIQTTDLLGAIPIALGIALVSRPTVAAPVAAPVSSR